MRRPTGLRRRRRAFSIVEVVAASVVFLVMAAGITTSVAQSMSFRATSAVREHLTGEMVAMLDEVAAAPFASLLADTFPVPAPCPASEPAGTAGSSCVDYAGRTYEVEWSVTFSDDVVVASTAAASYADVVVTSALPDGSPVARSRRVEAPTFGFTGAAVVRAQVAGTSAEVAAVDALYLLDADDPDTVRATAPLRAASSALFRVPASDCTVADPCVIGLSSGDNWTANGTVAIAPASSIAPTAAFALTAGQVHQVGVELFTPAVAVVEVLAATDAGTEAAPPVSVVSTVCLWAMFNDGVAQRLVPACNDTDADTVSFETYPYDPTDTTKRVPLPPVPVQFFVDHPNGSCPDVGQLGAVAGTYVSRAVCTSWTWGVPAEFRADAGATVYPYVVDPGHQGVEHQLAGGENTLAVVFSGDIARPAAGYPGQVLWANPREAGACASTASCTSMVTSTPEATVCPGSQCLSARVPTYIGPLVDTTPGVVLTSTSTVFSIEVDDIGGDPVTVQALSVPTTGTLRIGATPVSPGQILAVTDGEGPAAIALAFDDPPTEVSLVSFTVRISNLVPNGVRDIEIVLFRGTPAWTFESTRTVLGQNTTETVTVQAFAPGPVPAASASLSLAASPGLAVPASVTTDTAGVATFTVTAGAVAAGSYAVVATAAAGASVTVPVVVRPSPASVSISTPADIDQAGVTATTASVLDATGAPMANAQVSFTTALVGFATGVRTVPSSCTTSAAGECTVSVVADLAAPAGIYAVTARAGTASTTEPFTVTAVPAAVTAEAIRVTQGTSAPLAVTVVDGSGVPFPGETITVVSAPTGVTVTPASVVAGLDGTATFTATAAPSAPAGQGTVTVALASGPSYLDLTVDATPASLTNSGNLTVLRGSTVLGSIEVQDAAGDPVESAAVAFTAGTGVTIRTVTSSLDGTASFAVEASPTAAKGPRTVTATVAGYPSVTSTFTLVVQGTPASATVVGAIPLGGLGNFAVAVADAEGDPVAGATVTLAGLPAAVNVAPSSQTGVDGTAPFVVYETGALAAGIYRAKATVEYLDLTRIVAVVVPARSTPSILVAPATPSAPSVSSTASTTVTLAWSTPISNGGSPLTGYRVYRNASLVATEVSSPVVLTDLDPSTTYSFQVAACNVLGCSPPSVAVNATTPPPPVTGLAAVADDDRSVSLTWTLASPRAASLELRYRRSADPAWSSTTLSPAATSATVNGLDPGVEYTFVIAAGSSSGASITAEVTAVAVTRPARPAAPGVSATGPAERTISWTAPASSSPITTYRVFRDGLLVVVTASTSFVDVPPAMAVSNRYQVRACTALGCSAASPATAS